jgi:acyl-CoA synthetase (AMP-forming)/AMP-acid ligase II
MGGLTVLLTTLIAGAVACVIDTFTVPKFLRAVNDHAITSLFSVPSYVTQLVRHLQDGDNRSAVSHLNLSSLEDFLIAGEFMPQEISLKLLNLLPSVKRFRQSFGSTELGFAAIVPSDMANESNVLSSGIPSPGFQFKIMPRRDQDQGSSSFAGSSPKPLSPNQVGEIVAKGPQMANSYLNNPAADADSFDEEGFFYTGDGGFVDERGLLFVSDRFKEIIKFDGAQVSPAELESILLSHPAVQEAAVIGIPDPVHGHIPKAFVVLRDSCASIPLSPASSACVAGSGDQDRLLGAGDSAGEDTSRRLQTTTNNEAAAKRETCGAGTRTTTNVTEDQSSHNPLIVNELMHFVSNQVSSYKQIRGGIHVLPTFQRTILGKIDRKFLRSNFSSREAEEGTGKPQS